MNYQFRLSTSSLIVKKDDYDVSFFRNLFTVEKPIWGFPGEYEVKTFYLEDEHALYLPRCSIQLFDQHPKLKDYLYIDDKSQYSVDHSELFDGYDVLYEPRDDIQKKCYEHIIKDDYEDTLISISTGLGKTFISIYAAVKNKKKTIVFCHNNTILNQWVKAIQKFTNIPKNKIGIIGNGKKIDEEKLKECPFIIVSNMTFTRRLNDKDYSVVNTLNSLKTNYLIFDEGHYHFDCLVNASLLLSYDKQIFLTATPSRGLKEENVVYKYCIPFNNVFEHIESKLDYEVYFYRHNSKPDLKEFNYIAFNKFDNNRYADYTKKKTNDKRNYFKNLLKECIEVIEKHNKINDIKDKILIVGHKIDQLEFFYETLCEFYPEKKIARYYGSLLKSKENKPKTGDDFDFILAITRAVDAGFDIEDLTGMIVFPFIYKEHTFKQLKGRLARIYEGKKTALMIDLVDLGFKDMAMGMVKKMNILNEEGTTKYSLENAGKKENMEK
jgi:superfamily II DNA or RNA helicase